MASPAPDAPVADVKPADATPEKESKTEVNGHSTPVEPKPQTATETPKVNGAAKTEDEPAANGASKDVEMENGDDHKPSESTTKPQDEPSVTEKAEPASSKEEPESKAEPPAKEDVEMTDAAPAVDTAPAADAAPTVEATPSAGAPPAADATEKPTEAPVDEPVKSEKEDATASKKDEINGPSPAEPESTADGALPTSEVDLQPASLSQLAIESNETETPKESEAATAKPSIEIEMGDAPPDTSGTKVAREREDDASDEPAPKRARTEPKEEEPPASDTITATSVAGTATPTQSEGIPFPHRLTSWNDTELPKKPITAYQRREIRKVLGRIKKTKHGAHFRDSVQKLWPALWDSYVAKIEKPTDLAEIDRHLRDSASYPTWGHLKDDLKLMYDNTLAFNGPLHDVTAAARGSIKAIWEDVMRIPAEEPAKPKPIPKQKPPPRATAQAEVRKQAAPPPVTTAAERVKSSTPNREPSAEARRGSLTADLDRPKRSVRPPKPKDIDYTKPSRKKLKPELQFAEELLGEMMHAKNKHLNSWFLEPVDAEGLNIPQYYSIIKKPMDLGKISTMLSGGELANFKDFDKSVRLIFSNCYTFNGSVDQGNAVSYVAKQLEDFYNAQVKGKDAWLAKHAKASAPRAAGSDEEEEDEEDDAEDNAAPRVDPLKEVRELEAKLREESEKLNELFAADSPNSSLIEVQQGILRMVQQALLKAKSAANEHRSKQEKPSKKASKPSKPKAAGAPGRKQSTNAPPKKSGGSKKAAKKSLTAADKDAIANAINDLENAHLDRAIDIIKRDTGQNENNDGELELDIDQLSNEALLKLWELCKKVLPGFGKDSALASSPEVTRAQPAKSTGTKPKKNKPMSAKEQEERIAQLRGLRDLYKPGQDGPDGQGLAQDPSPAAESSDDSDSEEE